MVITVYNVKKYVYARVVYVLLNILYEHEMHVAPPSRLAIGRIWSSNSKLELWLVVKCYGWTDAVLENPVHRSICIINNIIAIGNIGYLHLWF